MNWAPLNTFGGDGEAEEAEDDAVGPANRPLEEGRDQLPDPAPWRYHSWWKKANNHKLVKYNYTHSSISSNQICTSPWIL